MDWIKVNDESCWLGPSKKKMCFSLTRVFGMEIIDGMQVYTVVYTLNI